MPAPRKYPLELTERGARMVIEMRQAAGQSRARSFAWHGSWVCPEALRHYVRQAEIDVGQQLGRAVAMRRGWRSWSGRTASSGGRTRSCARCRLLCGGARPRTQQVIDFIDAHRAAFGVEPICTLPAEAD